jgi:hypothetical protein
MTLKTFTHDQIADQCARRPAGYREQLMQAAVAGDERGVTFDTAHSAWAALKQRYQRRRRTTLKQAASFSRALLAGRFVSAETVAERLAICETCDQLRRDERGRWCAACGCGLSDAARQITNLAAYEENLPHWGCKHPRRSQGAGWKC